MDRPHNAGVGWSVVVPVKRLRAAKSRLALSSECRARLALAMAADTVAAATACAVVDEVIVVTDDAAVGSAVAATRVRVVADEPRAGLNEALEYGAHVARSVRIDAGVVALAADLPALRPDELATALIAAVDRSVVADRSGGGTTLLAAPSGTKLLPSYGADSFARHVAG